MTQGIQAMEVFYIEIGALRIAEPATLVTDYLMAGLAAWFCLRLIRSGRTWWFAAFGALGLCSLLGGTWHGFQLVLPPSIAAEIWRFTVLTGLLSSCCLLIATLQLLPGRERRWLVAAATFKLAFFLVWAWPSPTFLKVLADFSITFTVGSAVGWIERHRAPGFVSMFGIGILLFVLGGTIQAFKLAPHRWFNHNDLFHVFQILANTALYLAALQTPATPHPPSSTHPETARPPGA